MTKIKICGLSRPCDISFVNEGKPDYCGFIIQVPQSRRSLTANQVRFLREGLDDSILPVGVFVNAPVSEVAALLNDGTLSLAQLHGQEDNQYINKLKSLTGKPVIKAYSVSGKKDILAANESLADHLLFDHGSGGSGCVFDWSCLTASKRPFFLAGGLSRKNISEAIHIASPWAIDLSSGVETNGAKDREKILTIIHTVRRLT